MAEKFGIDSAFGNSAAVDGDVFVVLTRAVVVNDFWKKLLAGTAFAVDEHRQVDLRSEQSAANGVVERLGIANNAESLFSC